MRIVYDVEMTVPLGKRKGIMICEEKAGELNGSIEILGSVTKFTGSFKENKIVISGAFKTKVRDILYEGKGTADGKFISIRLVSGKSVYELTGRRRGQ